MKSNTAHCFKQKNIAEISNNRVFGKELTNLAYLNLNPHFEEFLKDAKKSKKDDGIDLENYLDFSFKDPISSCSTNDYRPNYPDFKAIYTNYGDPQQLEYYQDEIFFYLHHKKTNLINVNYMKDIQKDLNEKMRAILIDWLISVHLRFNLSSATLFLTVNIIDRFLEKHPIPRQKLQLVGLSSMLIAAKIEEIYYPEIMDLVSISDCSYGKKEIIDMEAMIVAKLNFDFNYTSPIMFVELYSKIEGFTEKMKIFCNYIVELALTEYQIIRDSSSLIAAGAIMLANKLYHKNQIISKELQKKSYLNSDEVKRVSNDLQLILKNQDKSRLKSVRIKYSTLQYLSISKAKFDLI